MQLRVAARRRSIVSSAEARSSAMSAISSIRAGGARPADAAPVDRAVAGDRREPADRAGAAGLERPRALPDRSNTPRSTHPPRPAGHRRYAGRRRKASPRSGDRGCEMPSDPRPGRDQRFDQALAGGVGIGGGGRVHGRDVMALRSKAQCGPSQRAEAGRGGGQARRSRCARPAAASGWCRAAATSRLIFETMLLARSSALPVGCVEIGRCRERGQSPRRRFSTSRRAAAG